MRKRSRPQIDVQPVDSAMPPLTRTTYPIEEVTEFLGLGRHKVTVRSVEFTPLTIQPTEILERSDSHGQAF